MTGRNVWFVNLSILGRSSISIGEWTKVEVGKIGAKTATLQPKAVGVSTRSSCSFVDGAWTQLRVRMRRGQRVRTMMQGNGGLPDWARPPGLEGILRSFESLLDLSVASFRKSDWKKTANGIDKIIDRIKDRKRRRENPGKGSESSIGTDSLIEESSGE